MRFPAITQAISQSILFISGFGAGRDVKCDRTDLVKERIYWEIMRKISELEDGR